MPQHLPDFYTTGPFPVINFGSLQLPTYYLINSIAACICILWVYKRAQRFQLSQRAVLDVSLIALVAGFGGARFLHVVYDLPSYYISHPIEIFYVWQGGFVFFGGLLAGYFASLAYLTRFERNLFRWHDLFAPVIALGYGLGRLSCLFHGCCYGKVCTYPWAIAMKQTSLETQLTKTIMRHPTPFYAMSWEFSLLALLLYLENFRSLKTGQLFFIWLGGHGLGRIIMEIFRDDYRGPQMGFLSISMGISLCLVAVSLYMNLVYFKKSQDPWFS